MNMSDLHNVLRRYCLSLTGSTWDADDLVQDTWVKAFGTLQRSGHANPEAFLLRIAKNTWIDQSRRKNVWERIVQPAQSAAVSAEHEIFDIETIFQALLKHMSPLQRTVFMLRDVFGYSSAESADMLETTEGAIKTVLYRARQSLGGVREEIEEGDFPVSVAPVPAGADQAVIVRRSAEAYLDGDAVAVMELMRREAVLPPAVGMARSRESRKASLAKRIQAHSALRMAA